MVNLFKSYLNNGNLEEALILGQNMLKQDCNNIEMFSMYFDLLIELAKNVETNNETYINQALSSLTYFAENVTLNQTIIDFIMQKKIEIQECQETLNQNVTDKNKEILKNAIIKNDVLLGNVKDLILEIKCSDNRVHFDKLVKHISEIDESINKKVLSKRQEKEYETLTTEYSKIIGEKLDEFKKSDEVKYNIFAVETYEKIFNAFKENNLPDNFEELIKEFCSFDQSKLFTETVLYYNYVYHFIFEKQNDETKLLLTKFVILCEKERKKSE